MRGKLENKTNKIFKKNIADIFINFVWIESRFPDVKFTAQDQRTQKSSEYKQCINISKRKKRI